MAPAAARRAAAAARRHVAAAPPRAAGICHAGPRGAGIRHAAPRASSIRHAGPRGAAIHHGGTAATHPSAVTTTHGFSSFAAGHLATRFGLTSGRTTHGFSSFAAGHLATRSGLLSGRLTRATAPTGLRFLHLMAARPIDPHVLLELRRLEARSFYRYKEIAEALQLLGQKLAEEELATLLHMTEQVIRIGTVSWRVCTTVLTVAVGAGIGVLQLSKAEWEREFDEAACSFLTGKLAATGLDLDDYMMKEIADRRNVAAAKAFLANRRIKEKASELAEREMALAARAAALVAREVALVPK